MLGVVLSRGLEMLGCGKLSVFGKWRMAGER